MSTPNIMCTHITVIWVHIIYEYTFVMWEGYVNTHFTTFVMKNMYSYKIFTHITVMWVHIILWVHILHCLFLIVKYISRLLNIWFSNMYKLLMLYIYIYKLFEEY